jgi:anti-sigma B factor antagonist
MKRAGSEDDDPDGVTKVIAVSGEFDVGLVGDLRRRVAGALAEGRRRVVVDLSGVTHMDSSGLAELITSQQRVAAAQGGFALVVTSAQIRRTLEIRGVRDMFTITASRDEATAALTR